MRVISLLLTKMVLVRFILILFGITAFILSLELIAYGDEILAKNNNQLSSIAEYALLRVPGISSKFIVICLLIATLLMLTEISRNSELIAIWNSGVSQFRLLVILLPTAIFIGAGHYILSDYGVTNAAPKLHEWAVGDYQSKALNVSEQNPLWMKSDRDIIRAVKANSEATILENVIIFKRDEDGILKEQIFAGKAELINERWFLSEVTIYYREKQIPVRLDQLIYSGPMRAASAGARSGDPEEMTLSTLGFFIKNKGFGLRPTYVYETWFHKRLATGFTALLALLIAVPLAHRYRRGGGLGVMFAFGIALGFGFFILEGIALTMGEIGVIPPWIAAWAPLIITAAASSTTAIRQESLT